MPKRDVAAAKRLLAEAGVKSPLAIEVMVPNNPEARQAAEVMQAMAREAGFDLKIRVTEFATALKLAEQGDFETFFIAWSGRTDPDGNVFVFDTCSGPINISKYCDAEVDRLLGEARQVNDPAKRKAIYKQVAEKVIVGGPILYLYHRMMFFAHTAKLQGFKAMPDGLIRVVGLKL